MIGERVEDPTFVCPEPMSRRQFEARQLIEALRFGVAPAQGVGELAIGLEKERASLIRGLNQVGKKAGAVRAVIGDYGFGKSHVVQWTTQEALARNFLVATTSLDLLELPPHRPFEIYSRLMRNLRYPDSDTRGLRHLLEKATDKSNSVVGQYRSLASVAWDSIAIVLDVFEHISSSRQHNGWLQWLEGGPRVQLMQHSGLPRGVKFPIIYKTGHNARQIGYLLGGISALARLVNYRGLCILIDEAESYSLLRDNQRPKARLFFQSMIYATLRDQQPHIDPDSLPQHRRGDYPAAFGECQSLFFLFTVTHSDKHLPLNQWLNEPQILTLNTHHNPRQIGTFLQQVLNYHTQAYAYPPDIRHGQIRRAAAEHLALGIRHNRISIRGLVRLAVELFDLLYLHQDIDVAELLSQLRKQMRGAYHRR
ncbi:MAG: BREX system ATP-binding domain-containing protein [Ardenticatenaceae bacterium]